MVSGIVSAAKYMDIELCLLLSLTMTWTNIVQINLHHTLMFWHILCEL